MKPKRRVLEIRGQRARAERLAVAGNTIVESPELRPGDGLTGTVDTANTVFLFDEHYPIAKRFKVFIDSTLQNAAVTVSGNRLTVPLPLIRFGLTSDLRVFTYWDTAIPIVVTPAAVLAEVAMRQRLPLDDEEEDEPIPIPNRGAAAWI